MVISSLKPYSAYRDSGVSWLGEVPTHWGVQSLGSLTTARGLRGRPDLPLLSVVREKGVIPRASMTDDENRNFIPDDLSNYKVVREGDLVVNKMKAWQGSLGIAPENGIVSPAYYVFDFRMQNKRFGHVLLRSKRYVAMFAQASDGVRVGQWDLSIDGMKRIPIVVPPDTEQFAIVRFLHDADRRIAGYIRVKRRLIVLLDEQKQKLIHEAVTRGLDASVAAKPSGLPWLGEIPAHWELRRAKQLCLAIIDCKNRTPEMVPGGDYTVVRTTCIRNGQFDISGSYPTDRKNYEVWTQRGAPRRGDVFFTREAPAGEACLVPDLQNLCMGQRMMYFRPDPEVLDPKFLLYSIYGPLVRRYIDHMGAGSTVSHLRLGQVYAMPLLWCPLPEQREIVARLEEAANAISAAQTRAQREVELIREFRTRLIADVVTGKLDVREAAAKLPNEPEDPVALDEAEMLEGEDAGDGALEAVGAEAEA